MNVIEKLIYNKGPQIEKIGSRNEEDTKDCFMDFLVDFQKELGKTFNDVKSCNLWCRIGETYAWHEALSVSSRKHMPEIIELFDKLNWWSSDLLDSWLIDCAKYIGLIR